MISSSQFLCSQSWLHLWLWHVFLWSNQLCIQILPFSYPRNPSNSSSFSSFYSHSSCKFTCLQPNLTTAFHFTLASHKQISTNFNAFKIHWHVSLQTLQNINTSHQHSKNYIGFLSNKESITKFVFTHAKHIQINNLHEVYKMNNLYNSLSFPSHSVSTRSSDSLVLSIPYVRSWQMGFLCHRSTTLEFTPSWYPKLVSSTNIPFQAQNTPFSKLRSLPRLFPISLDSLSWFWFLLQYIEAACLRSGWCRARP